MSVLIVSTGCSTQCSTAKDSIAVLEDKNTQIKELALQAWEQEKQYSVNNSSWGNRQDFEVLSMRQIYSDFEDFFGYNGKSEYLKNQDLMNRIIVNNVQCFDPIVVAEAEQLIDK